MTLSASCLDPFWLEITDPELKNLMLRDKEKKIQIHGMCFYCRVSLCLIADVLQNIHFIEMII